MMIRFSPASEFVAGGNLAGRREGRLSERLPAAPVASASAGVFIPSKVTVSRTFSHSGVATSASPASASSQTVSRSDAEVGRSQKRFIIVSKRFLIAARSSLETGNAAQAMFDAFAVLFFALFVSLFSVGVGLGVFILIFVAF